MTAIVLPEKAAASVATPATGYVSIFVDSADGDPKMKDDAGAVTSLVGTAGAAGQGVPTGGTVGQVLRKVSGTDYDTAWADATIPIGIACSDESTALTTGNGKATFRMPFAMTLTAVRASVTTAPTGAVLTVDINESGTTILSTKLTIDAGEKTSTTAATPAVISDTALADDAEITIDIDQIGSTIAGAGLKVWLIGRRA